jgi:predicted phosphate transport protein (TIGR00153 family)
MLFGNAKDLQFFTLLRDSAQNIAVSVQAYNQMLSHLDQAPAFAERLKALEKKGDGYTREMIALLNRLFITPLDREDLLALAVKLDDVIDGLEAAAARIRLYKLTVSDRFLTGFGELIKLQVEQILQAMQRLQEKNLQGVRENAVQINELENHGDDLLRQALEELFEREQNPVMIIKLKEIYETLESVTDRAEDVANALEGVVMKNS